MTKDSKHLSFPELKDYIVKYQNPEEADPISKIQRELDETKVTIHKTINSVLERGEKIEDLVAKSDGLSAQSKMFYTQVRIEADLHTFTFADSISRPRSKIHAASSCKYYRHFLFWSSDHLEVNRSRATPLVY
jgi:hypothetical protein